MPPNILRLF